MPTALISNTTSKLPQVLIDDTPDDPAERLLIILLISAAPPTGARTISI